jgi:hypothetical protein
LKEENEGLVVVTCRVEAVERICEKLSALNDDLIRRAVDGDQPLRVLLVVLLADRAQVVVNVVPTLAGIAAAAENHDPSVVRRREVPAGQVRERLLRGGIVDGGHEAVAILEENAPFAAESPRSYAR